MSAPVPTPVVFDGRVIADPLLERAMIAAVVRDPRLLSAVPGVGLAEFNDALANLRQRSQRARDPRPAC